MVTANLIPLKISTQRKENGSPFGTLPEGEPSYRASARKEIRKHQRGRKQHLEKRCRILLVHSVSNKGRPTPANA